MKDFLGDGDHCKSKRYLFWWTIGERNFNLHGSQHGSSHPWQRSCGEDLTCKGESGLERPPGPAWASTPKPKSVCFTISRLSPTFLTLPGVGVGVGAIFFLDSTCQWFLNIHRFKNIYPGKLVCIFPLQLETLDPAYSVVLGGKERMRDRHINMITSNY